MRIKNIAAAFLWWSGIGHFLRFFWEPRLIAIAYHRVSDVAHPLAISPRAFTVQIAYLKKRGYQFARFHELAQDYAFPRVREKKRNRQTIKSEKAEKKAAIYFDDGFRDLPAMDMPATFFLVTDYLDQKNGGEYLAWQNAAPLKTRGEIGSHSATHRKLTKMPLAEAREEMARSKQLLEERLGIEVTSFSYPKGRSSPELETLAREAGYTITTADTRFRKVRPDPGESLSIFKLKIIGLL